MAGFPNEYFSNVLKSAKRAPANAHLRCGRRFTGSRRSISLSLRRLCDSARNSFLDLSTILQSESFCAGNIVLKWYWTPGGLQALRCQLVAWHRREEFRTGSIKLKGERIVVARAHSECVVRGQTGIAVPGSTPERKDRKGRP